VYEGSDHPEAAAEFITWFTSLENNWSLIEGGIWMPRYESWSHDEALMREWADNENHPPFDDFRSAIIEFSLTNAEPAGWHWVPGYDMLQIELGTILGPVWSGDQTALEALTAGRPALLTAIGAD
jgi:multiple sugar transport system substrate-binding protein